jgi:hypothetical protein
VFGVDGWGLCLGEERERVERRHVVGSREGNIERKCHWMREIRKNCLEYF